jgi:hypothetical protein
VGVWAVVNRLIHLGQSFGTRAEDARAHRSRPLAAPAPHRHPQG